MSHDIEFVVRCIGKITEVIGPCGDDKNKIIAGLICRTQASGGIVALIDNSNSIDVNCLEAEGVDLKDLLVSQPNGIKEYAEITKFLVASQEVDLLLIDIAGNPHLVWDSPSFAYMNFGQPEADSPSGTAVFQGVA